MRHRKDTSYVNRQRGLLVLGAVLFMFSCTDAALQFKATQIEQYDDLLTVTGSFCTSPSDELTYPVKILVVMDQSASLQCTDPADNRINAMNRAGWELDALPNVQFGVVGFASWSNILEFTPSWSEALNQQLDKAMETLGPRPDGLLTLQILLDRNG